jgi:hypothetical protein
MVLDCMIIIIFQGLGLLVLSGSEFIFWNLWIYWTVGRTPWMGDWPNATPLPTHRTTQHRKTWTHIHASSGIQTCNPSIWTAKDNTCLRQLSHWDWQVAWFPKKFSVVHSFTLVISLLLITYSTNFAPWQDSNSENDRYNIWNSLSLK